MNYNETVAKLQTLLEIPLNQEDSNFTRIIPLMFAYADGRIYRELDFIATTVTLIGKLTARKRNTLLPADVLVLRQLNVCTPATMSVTDNSERHTPERVSPEALDMFWPTAARVGLPKYYAVVGDTPMAAVLQPLAGVPKPPPPKPQVFSRRVRFGPAPDQAYPVEFLGVIRPAILSPTNPETYLSVTYPDLFCAACMVFGAGYQRDYGAQADDPAKAMSWEGQYQALKRGIELEAARMRGMLQPVPAGAA